MQHSRQRLRPQQHIPQPKPQQQNMVAFIQKQSDLAEATQRQRQQPPSATVTKKATNAHATTPLPTKNWPLVLCHTTQNLTPVIPLNLFQTWHSLELPVYMKAAVAQLKAHNPEFKHHLYDDAMCAAFLLEYFSRDVVEAFHKLVPGAYKADLWRYCILYVYGGIYLDIKFECVGDFKLLQLTDQEYWVSERNLLLDHDRGVYQGLLVSMPQNPILRKCITQLVENVQQNFYGSSTLAVTGPALVGNFFTLDRLRNHTYLKLAEDGYSILMLNNTTTSSSAPLTILKKYSQYVRKEQFLSQVPHYQELWEQRLIYKYPCLVASATFNFTSHVTMQINGENITFYSSTPFLMQNPLSTASAFPYLVNTRWINYMLHNDGSVRTDPRKVISLNSFEYLNHECGVVTPRQFVKGVINTTSKYNGFEDVRLYTTVNGTTYYFATTYDAETKLMSMSSDEITLLKPSFNLNIIRPTFLNYKPRIEKNWTPFPFYDTMGVVYQWKPLHICTIDYTTNTLNTLHMRYDVPAFFDHVRGGSPGVVYENEIWFVLHVSQKFHRSNYQHFFAVFNRDMRLQRYSELFKFQNKCIEYCIGLVIEPTRFLLSYSVLDKSSYVSAYDPAYLLKSGGLKWINYNLAKGAKNIIRNNLATTTSTTTA
jgi:mannosyltransferase OCH1-like enzyme